MKKSGIIIILLALAACDAAEDSARRVGSGLEENYDKTRKHLSKWIYRWNENEAEAPPPKILANSYCYQVQMDILCYEEPQARLGTRLIAYQGSTAYPPGYVAPAAQMQAMPSPDPIVSYDVPPPFSPASDETMAKANASNQAGASAADYNLRPVGPPKGLMTGK